MSVCLKLPYLSFFYPRTTLRSSPCLQSNLRCTNIVFLLVILLNWPYYNSSYSSKANPHIFGIGELKGLAHFRLFRGRANELPLVLTLDSPRRHSLFSSKLLSVCRMVLCLKGTMTCKAYKHSLFPLSLGRSKALSHHYTAINTKVIQFLWQ